MHLACLPSEMRRTNGERRVSGRMEVPTRSTRVIACWLLIGVAGLVLVALANRAFVALGDSGNEGLVVAGAAPPTPAATEEPAFKAHTPVKESDRTPIPVMVGRRAHGNDECRSSGRVPIAVMIACHQKA